MQGIHPDLQWLRGDCREATDFLAARLYEFNCEATGYRDAEEFAAVKRDAAGAIVAGVSGFTWGGCCFIEILWVSPSHRRQGWGRALLAAAEQNASSRGCSVIVLSSHSFQAPIFYARFGYEMRGKVENYPVGHRDYIFAKRLGADGT